MANKTENEKGLPFLFFLKMAILFFAQYNASAQSIPNGSFESNSFACGINLRNETINGNLPGITAFGQQSEIDLLQDSCGYGIAQEGLTFIALYYRNFSDAFSFRLSEPLVSDRTYTLYFSGMVGKDIVNPDSKVEIGLSDQADQFGNLVFTSERLGTTWKEYSFDFEAESSVEFLTIRTRSNNESWVYLDNFYLGCPNLHLGNDTTVCKASELSFSVPAFYDEILWKNGSTAPESSPMESGWFWVEAREGNCTLRDSVRINEYANQCQCSFYFPTAFSPDGNGINDTFGGFSNCEPQLFLLQIFDRWGNLVFESKDSSKMWDGTFKNKKMTPDTFVYRAAYTFEYSSDWELQSGFFNLFK
jgi:gliding motility-associated-like protein